MHSYSGTRLRRRAFIRPRVVRQFVVDVDLPQARFAQPSRINADPLVTLSIAARCRQ